MKKLLLSAVCLACCAALFAAPAKAKKRVKPQAKKPAVQTVSFTLPLARTDAPWSTRDYPGTPLLVAVLSAKCPYCRQTLPQLEEARRSLKDVQFVAVFVEESPLEPLAVLKELNARLDAVYGGRSVAQTLGVNGYPNLFLYDSKHHLIKKWDGYSETRVKELKDAAGGLEKEVTMVSVEGL